MDVVVMASKECARITWQHEGYSTKRDDAINTNNLMACANNSLIFLKSLLLYTTRA